MDIKKYSPFVYQETAIEIGLEVLTSHKPRSEVLVAPVAAGKSIIIAEIVKRLPKDGNILVIQPNKELTEQNIEKVESLGVKVSTYSASLGKKELGRVTYATPGSIDVVKFKKFGFKYCLMDECFPKDTAVICEDSIQTFGELYDKHLKGEKLPLVKSYNEKKDTFEFKPIKSVFETGVRQLINLKFTKNVNHSTTPNHPFYTPRGWVNAGDLKKYDTVFTSIVDDRNPSTYKILNQDQMSVLIGSSLGDGYLDKRPKYGLTRVYIKNGEKQKDYLLWKANILNAENSVEYIENNGYASTPAYRFVSDTISIDDNLKKYSEQINNLDLKGLAVLWMDDGTLSKRNNGGALYSLCESEENVNLLNNRLKYLGIRDTVVRKTKSPGGRDIWYIGFRKISTEDFSRLCAPYIHKSMEYKILPEYRENVGTYKWDNTRKKRVVQVLDVNTGKKDTVYNMEVDDNHTYVIASKTSYKSFIYNVKSKKPVFDGIIVHNCDHGSKDGTNLKRNLKLIGINNILGFTATPIYMQQTLEGSVLKIMTRTRNPMFKDICHVIQIEEIVKNKRWAELKYIEYEFDSKGLILNSTGSDYTEESVIVNYVESNAESKILSIINTIGKERALVFVPGIKNVDSLFKRLEAEKISVGYVHSKMSKKDREHTLKGFREGAIQVLINSLVLLAGYDDPTLENLIDAFPTNSARVNYQKIGRIVRVGKKVGKVHCISGNYEKFGSIEDITFENVENYGWGMFVKGFLVSGVPMKENINITKDDLINGRAKKNTNTKRKVSYDFVYQGNLESDKFTFGKYKGLTVAEVYSKDKGYLNWMYKMIKEQNAFGDKKNKSIKTKILELFDKSLPF